MEPTKKHNLRVLSNKEKEHKLYGSKNNEYLREIKRY